MSGSYLEMTYYEHRFFSIPKILHIISKESHKINIRDEFGRTPMLWAIDNNLTSLVEQLLGFREVKLEDFNDDGDTALICACKQGFLPIIRLLLKYSPNVNVVNKSGKTPLYYLLINESREGIKLLLKFDVGNLSVANIFGETALHLAVRKGWVELIDMLFEIGADKNAKNIFGLTPIDLMLKSKL